MASGNLFPQLLRPSGRRPARRKPRPGLFASGNLFPQLLRPSGRRPARRKPRPGFFMQALVCPILASNRCVLCSIRPAELTTPTQAQNTGIEHAIKACSHRSRTKVRFAPLSSQSARLIPMLADFFANASHRSTSAPERAPPPNTVSSHKKMPASLRAFSFTACGRHGRKPSTPLHRNRRSCNAAKSWGCCSCAPKRDR